MKWEKASTDRETQLITQLQDIKEFNKWRSVILSNFNAIFISSLDKKLSAKNSFQLHFILSTFRVKHYSQLLILKIEPNWSLLAAPNSTIVTMVLAQNHQSRLMDSPFRLLVAVEVCRRVHPFSCLFSMWHLRCRPVSMRKCNTFGVNEICLIADQ